MPLFRNTQFRFVLAGAGSSSRVCSYSFRFFIESNIVFILLASFCLAALSDSQSGLSAFHDGFPVAGGNETMNSYHMGKYIDRRMPFHNMLRRSLSTNRDLGSSLPVHSLILNFEGSSTRRFSILPHCIQASQTTPVFIFLIFVSSSIGV